MLIFTVANLLVIVSIHDSRREIRRIRNMAIFRTLVDANSIRS